MPPASLPSFASVLWEWCCSRLPARKMEVPCSQKATLKDDRGAMYGGLCWSFRIEMTNQEFTASKSGRFCSCQLQSAFQKNRQWYPEDI